VALLALVAVLGVLLAIGLASDDGGDDDSADTRPTTTERTRPTTQEEPPPPTRVRVRIEPATLTYMCIDRGPGTDVIFEQSTDTAQTFRGRRVRLLLGKRDVTITMNGEPVEVPPGAEPIGFGFTPAGSRELPAGEGPCV
jgi:hypothetical protein